MHSRALLIDAADAIADMAQRVQRNGPEPTYASESSATRFTRRRKGSPCAAPGSISDHRTTPRLPPRPKAPGRGGITLAGTKPGDIVLADGKGRQFFAIVMARCQRGLEVDPLDRGVTYRHVGARGDRRLAKGAWRQPGDPSEGAAA